jgi:nucleotide-binding universal stress UspA family protein
MTTHRFLVPTDLSEFGGAALQYAAVLRGPLDATITVLYADEPGYPVATPDLPLGTLGRTPQEKETIVRYVRDQVVKHVPPPLPEIRVESSFAATAILETAEAVDATMIIMGTHGRRGLRRLLLGSVAENTVRETTRPVLTVRPLPAAAAPVIGSILCPVNFTAVAAAALEYAADLSKRLNAPLTVLHVEEESAPAGRLEENFSSWLGSRLRGQTRYERVTVTGDAADEVLTFAEEMKPGLLVVGVQHKRFRESTVIGSTSERIIRFATFPVLTVGRSAG